MLRQEKSISKNNTSRSFSMHKQSENKHTEEVNQPKSINKINIQRVTRRRRSRKQKLQINIVTGNFVSGVKRACRLPNYQLKELVLVEDLAVEVQHPDAGPLHAGPGRQAQVQAVLQRTLADREAALQFRAGYRWKPIRSRIIALSLRSFFFFFTTVVSTQAASRVDCGESRTVELLSG